MKQNVKYLHVHYNKRCKENAINQIAISNTYRNVFKLNPFSVKNNQFLKKNRSKNFKKNESESLCLNILYLLI